LLSAYRKRIPIIRDSVTTVTTPGETIDVIVTELGIAINPRRKDLVKHFKKSKLPICDIHDMKQKVDDICGGQPPPPKTTDRIIALIEYRDGTIIDKVMQVKE